MIQNFKIRASKSGEIMGDIGKPTPKQLALLAQLQAKEKRTANQDETLAELIKKRDAKPNLQVGAKTYCQMWLKEQADMYNRVRQFSNRYTEKGVLCEPSAIEMLGKYMDYGLISKNEKHFEDADLTGTPDVLLPHIVEDVKNSWDFGTFPLFATELPDSDYYYQLQCYMALAGRNKAAVTYCLIDAPNEIIDQEARRQWYKAGGSGSEVDFDLYDEVAAKMTYANIPMELRIKRFEFDRDEAVISTIRGQVKLCREYINETLLPILKTKRINITVHDQVNNQPIEIVDKI